MMLTAFVSGLLFGFGVLAVLDLAGNWDPSLMLVMGGAIAVAAPAFAWAKRRQRTLLGARLELPQARQIDRRLLVGSALFGAGWDIAGICPGPALVLLSQGKAIIFALAMFAGMALHAVMDSKR